MRVSCISEKGVSGYTKGAGNVIPAPDGDS